MIETRLTAPSFPPRGNSRASIRLADFHLKSDNPGVGLGRVAVVVGFATLFASPGAAAPPTQPAAILYGAGGDEDDECGSIWSVDPRGGEPRQLDVGPGRSCDPDWSPDGRSIAFTGNQGGSRYRIYVSDANGKNPAPVSHPLVGQDDFMAAWSPDGIRIVFERRSAGGGNHKPFIVGAAGTDERPVSHRDRFRATPRGGPRGGHPPPTHPAPPTRRPPGCS